MPQTIACNLCRNRTYHKLFVGKDYWLQNPGEFQLVRCDGCGVVYINPQPSQHELADYYPDNYYAFRPTPEARPPGSLRRRISQRLKENRLLSSFPDAFGGRRALDVGCGRGDFLPILERKGWLAEGVEPFSGALAGQQLGRRIFHGNLLDAGLPADHFQFIRLRHVYEHVPNPRELLEELARILAPGGILEIQVPNYGGLNAHLFGRYWHQLDAPRHLYHYTPGLLKKLLQDQGLRPSSARYGKSHMGTSLRYALRERGPAWLEGNRWRLVSLLLKLTRPFFSLLSRTPLGDEMTVRAIKATR